MRIAALSRLASGLLLAGALSACGDSSTAPPWGPGGDSPAGTGNEAGAADSGGSRPAPSVDSGKSSDSGTPVSTPEAGSDDASNSVDDSGTDGATNDTDGGAGPDGGAGIDAPDDSGGNPAIPAVKFVVYLDDWSGGYGSWASKIDFTKMTHLNLAFVEATTDNNWQFVDGQSDTDVKALVDKAHAAGVKVLVSLGGGGTDSTVVNQYMDPSHDDALVSNVDALLKRLNLDGADVDVEKESTNEVGDKYAAFVSKLIATLRPEGKLVTAAVAQYLQGYMNDDTLHSFDFVNIMTYSANTSDYSNDVAFYTGQKGMDKTKVTLGIISESDQRTSVQTTQAITAIAKDYGGAMLWDLAEDSTDQSSVYKAIQGSL
jgi:GH18 family chitinase